MVAVFIEQGVGATVAVARTGVRATIDVLMNGIPSSTRPLFLKQMPSWARA